MSENTNEPTETSASSSVTASAPAERRTALPVWLIATIAGFFGLFYAYAVWNAVAFLISQATGPPTFLKPNCWNQSESPPLSTALISGGYSCSRVEW